MSYLIMECHDSYAVVLGEDGHFLKVANFHYQVGASVTEVVPLQESRPILTIYKWMARGSILAACLCIAMIGTFQFWMSSYGALRMKINPEVLISVNRLDYVIALEGVNEDGEILTKDYSFQWKKLSQVSYELTDRAMEEGYLAPGGTIRLLAESRHEDWKASTENRILEELETYLNHTVIITVGPAESDDSLIDTPLPAIVIPVVPEQPPSSDTENFSGTDEDDRLPTGGTSNHPKTSAKDEIDDDLSASDDDNDSAAGSNDDNSTSSDNDDDNSTSSDSDDDNSTSSDSNDDNESSSDNDGDDDD